MAAVGSARVFSSLDIKAGFHNIPICEDRIGWMAFATQDGLYKWLRMPFGPKGAPAHFQRMVQISIEAVQNGRILVYIDDILVTGDDPREVWERTMDVLRALAKAGFMINIRKSKFCEPAAKIVGMHITR